MESEKIKEQIEYEYICTPYNREQVDEFVELMLEVVLARSPTIEIGRETEYPIAFVQERFSRLTSSHIEKVLNGIKAVLYAFHIMPRRNICCSDITRTR